MQVLCPNYVKDNMKAVLHSIISCNILDNHLMSDHVPIEMTINVDVVHRNYSLRHATPKFAWDRASEEEISQYKSHLDVLKTF